MLKLRRTLTRTQEQNTRRARRYVSGQLGDAGAVHRAVRRGHGPFRFLVPEEGKIEPFHGGTAVLVFAAETDAIVLGKTTGEILADLTLHAAKDYQSKKKHPGPKAGV
jgi:hypothetical protein